MKLFFIRPPRYLWPFNSESSSFWQPLGFASMAAVLRENIPGIEVRIIDSLALKLGWKSLEALLREELPDVVCIGEETVSSGEGTRLAQLVKDLNPPVTTIAGGCYFSFAVEDTLRNHPIDFIVKSEGEETLLELVQTLKKREPDYTKVKGIALRDENNIVETEPRELIENLDELPMPAYDLLPMRLYGKGSRNHPNLTAIEHGRGCVDRCSFCTLWKQMGRVSVTGEGSCAHSPCYRTKSPQKVFREVEILAERYDRQTLGWVDPCWNVDLAWTEEFCDLMLRSDLRLWSTAWMRADFVARDERLGILEKQVKAGLRQAIIGVERIDNDELSSLGKHNNSVEVTKEAFQIFRKKYPQVYTIGTIVYGLWNETEESIESLMDFARSSGMDYELFIPLTPNPGTELWEEAKRKNLIEIDDFRMYNFITPVMRTKQFSTRELQDVLYKSLVRSLAKGARRFLGQVVTQRDERRRNVHRALFAHGVRVSSRNLLDIALRALCPSANRNASPVSHYITPKWYDD